MESFTFRDGGLSSGIRPSIHQHAGRCVFLGECMGDGGERYTRFSRRTPPVVDETDGLIHEAAIARCGCGDEGCSGHKLISPKPGFVDARKMVFIDRPDYFRTLNGEHLNIVGEGTSALVILSCRQPFCFTSGDSDEEFVLFCETPEGDLMAFRRSEFEERYPDLATRLAKRMTAIPVPVSGDNMTIPAEVQLP